MSILKITITLVLLLLSVIASAQEVRVNVIENGNPKEIVISHADLEASLKDKIQRYYANQGFFDVIITDSIQVSTGTVYQIDDVIFLGNNSLSDYNLNLVGRPFTNQKVENALEVHLERLISDGYIHAKVEITDLQIDSIKKTVRIFVREQKDYAVHLSKIRFLGNELNSDAFIKKVSFLEDSIFATKQNLNQLKRNIVATELFEDVSEPELFSENGKVSALIYVQERQLNSLDGLIGYVPDSQGNGQIVGDVTVSLWNVLTEGNGFDLQYQRLKPETSRLNVGVTQHWIFGLPFELGTGINFYQNDTTYQTRNLFISADYKITSELKLTSNLFTQASNSANVTVTTQEPDARKQGANLGFIYQNLDAIDVPTRGIHLNISYGFANKDFKKDSSGVFNQQNILLKVNSFYPVFKQSVLASSLQGYVLTGSPYSESDLIRFGGANSLRGYAEEQFIATKLIWGDVEYRFLTDQSSYLFLFGATGYYERPQLINELDQIFAQKDWLYSGGFGLSYKTAIGRLTFSYALSSNQALSNGKVHFGIRTSL